MTFGDSNSTSLMGTTPMTKLPTDENLKPLGHQIFGGSVGIIMMGKKPRVRGGINQKWGIAD